MTPLLLIPGMMCGARMWGDLAPLGRDIHHHLPDQVDSMPALAALVLQTAPPRFALAGLSMGGIVAMEILRQAPTRVTHLALLDTNPLAETPEAQSRRLPQIAKVKAGGLTEVMRDEMKPNYLSEGPHKPQILNLCMHMALTLGPETFIRQSRALATRPDQTATLAAFHGPALVLMGAQDGLCPRARHDLMHELMPQSRLFIVDDAAHLPPLENPTQTLAALSRWLED
ncbi:MAG: alpha/beta fold hydrolase [Candidatus Saccharibacteria bacterium]|nr:alpha/beta fold hydrolase [Pseudorhodobacter sp.]